VHQHADAFVDLLRSGMAHLLRKPREEQKCGGSRQ
jgi:hypothetical protein